jgi:hypothetical protein
MSSLSLGQVTLRDFEIPGRIGFGGAQAMTVHKLLGGTRVIDVLGRDDADVTWSGVMSGADASGRARLLDAMRAAGNAIALSWDVLYYQVIIADLRLTYTNPWWIPYRITCRVVADQAQLTAAEIIGTATAIADDLAAASAFADVSGAIAAISPAGALTAGTQANYAATVALAGSAASIAQGIAAAEQGLQANDVPSLVAAAGSLATLVSAQGYVARAFVNLENVSS